MLCCSATIQASTSILPSQDQLTQEQKNEAFFQVLQDRPDNMQQILYWKSQGAKIDRANYCRASKVKNYVLLKRLLIHDTCSEMITFNTFPIHTIDMDTLKVLATDQRFNLNLTENTTRKALIHWTSQMCLEDIVLFLRYLDVDTQKQDQDGKKPILLAQAALRSEQRSDDEPEIMHACQRTVKLMAMPLKELNEQLTPERRVEFDQIRMEREMGRKNRLQFMLQRQIKPHVGAFFNY